MARLADQQAFALFAAGELLDAGFSPRALMRALDLDLVPLEDLRKYAPDQPRDDHGRWTVGAGSSGGSGASLVSDDMREGRSVSPGSPHGGANSEDDKLEDFKSKFEEDSPQADIQHGRPIDPLGPTPLPFGGTRPTAAPGAASRPKPSDFVGQDFGKYGIGVEKPKLKSRYLTRHSVERQDRQPLSRVEVYDVVSNPLLVTRQSHSRFYFLNDNGAVAVDDSGRVVTNYRSSDFKQGVLDMLARVHSGGR